MSNKKVDYLIVGASVAGSVLAAKFAAKGTTLFVDKYMPGTLMNCGGGMPEKIFASFGVDIPSLSVKRAVMNIKGRECWFPCNYVVVNRSVLDHALYKKAQAAGAEFKKLNYVSHDPKAKTALFKENKQELTIHYEKLVFAYGFHPGKEPFFGKKRNMRSGAARVEVLDTESPHPDQFYFYIYQQNLPGYHWIFPMPDGKVNIGSGGFKSAKVPLASIAELKNEANLDAEIYKKGGGVLPLAPAGRIQQGNVYCFGDAAGMVNALNGEGLMHIAEFSDTFVDGVSKNKKMNVVWRLSGTFWYLLCAAIVLKILIFLGSVSGIPFYPLSCRMVAFLRRCKR